MSQEIDVLFGFTSDWTFIEDDGCWELGGKINIDLAEAKSILSDAGLGDEVLQTVVWFFMGHEKGHHLQEIRSPKQDYGTDHFLMEIEADLYGAWLLGKKGISLSKQAADGIREFDDYFRIGKALGISTGDNDGNSPHHPWAEQRHLAISKADTLSVLHPNINAKEDRDNLSCHIESLSHDLKVGRIGPA